MTLPAPTPDAATLAVVVARLDDLREDMAALRQEVRTAANVSVGRGEWLQRNSAVDARFEGQGREIAELKNTQAASRAPWWAAVSALAALGSVAYNLLA